MKKEISINNEDYYRAKYIISKKKWAVYNYYKKDNYRGLEFYRNRKKNESPSTNTIYVIYFRHRSCNIGPQFKDKQIIEYNEYDKLHNLYGPARISKINNTKDYYINDIHYKEDNFNNYISIYNKLSYKRTYI